jgi:preprotein translocase subunit SecG
LQRGEIAEPHLDEGTHLLLEPVLPREGQRLLVALPRLLRRDPLLEAVVARDQELADALAHVVHATKARLSAVVLAFVSLLAFDAGIHVLLSAALLTLILMHSGRDAGMGGMGFTPASQGGTHIVERNLTRLTAVVSVLFFANSVALFHFLK